MRLKLDSSWMVERCSFEHRTSFRDATAKGSAGAAAERFDAAGFTAPSFEAPLAVASRRSNAPPETPSPGGDPIRSMRKFRGRLSLLAILCTAAAGDVRIERGGPDNGVERSPQEIVSDVRTLSTRHDPERSAVALTRSDGADSTSCGRFRLLTYNVAGLPDLVSPSHPAVNCAQTSPLLNQYDLIFIQEDFSYHEDLGSHALHRFRSEPMRTSLALIHDGLSMFSSFAIGKTRRMRWTRCSGYLSGASDCLADKGFSFAEVTLAPGVTIDTYNLHADSGSGRADVEARRANFDQLERFMRARPVAHAVIVAGDTNLSPARSGDVVVLDEFLRTTGLADVCETVECPDVGIDRVFVRNTAETRLSPLGWWKDSRFVDAEGAALSDHPAIGVELEWRYAVEPAPVMARATRP
jgi:endonuclease/exonuclease/phosphatase family metal-dependent hydrolase